MFHVPRGCHEFTTCHGFTSYHDDLIKRARRDLERLSHAVFKVTISRKAPFPLSEQGEPGKGSRYSPLSVASDLPA